MPNSQDVTFKVWTWLARDQIHFLQVLSDILETCGDNIDAAIKRLGDLRLTANCSGAVLHAPAEPAPAAGPLPLKSPSKAGKRGK